MCSSTSTTDPAQIYRQRIYAFQPDYEANAIRLTIYTPNDVAPLVDAHLDPAKLAGLTPEQTRVLPGCDVFWQRRANHFVGYMEPDACSYVSRESNKRIIFNDDLLLTQDALWISDRARGRGGKCGIWASRWCAAQKPQGPALRMLDNGTAA